MELNTIQALDARQKFGELLELAYYKDRKFCIKRKNKPMAWLVGEPFMNALKTILEKNPNLAETIEIMLDEKLMTAIKKGNKEVKAGKTIPIEKALKD